MRKGGTYLAIGDSITWTNSGGTVVYGMKVKDFISNTYSPIKFINKGIGGQTSTELLKNINWNSQIEADLITIGIGMNDCSSQVVPLATYKTNLTSIINRIKKLNPNAHIILCTPSHTTDTNRTPYIQAYRDAMAEVATSTGVSICRFENAWLEAETSANTSDGIHPNDTGHQKLFDVLKPIVELGAWLNKLG